MSQEYNTQEFGGEHTEIKLDVLKKYAKSYLNALKSTDFFGLCYIDGFAGSGERVNKYGDIREGSAKLILKNIDLYPADAFFFIEKEKKYADSLKELAEKARKKLNKEYDPIKIIHQDVNNVLPELVNDIFSTCYGYDPASNRVLIFLDPFGLQVDFSTLEKIADSKVDVVLLFPISGLYRNLAKNQEVLDKEPSKIKKVSKILGIDNWITDIYKTVGNDLFGNENNERVSVDKLEQYITERYKTIFKGYVSEPLRLYYSGKVHAFSLYLLTSNTSGKAIGLASKLWKQATKDY